ncbi:MAG: glycosyltransferase [Haliea sp.]|nr:glycosyltransferase [Haliea sp.]
MVVAACPDIKLNVVGSNTPDSVKALAGKHVIVHGYLSDDELAERYRQTRMVAVPLRFGAGVKGKILEAMQHGVPLVTTAIGAEGFAEPNIVFNIKETPADFAQELIEIEEHGCSAKLRKQSLRGISRAIFLISSRAREI